MLKQVITVVIRERTEQTPHQVYLHAQPLWLNGGYLPCWCASVCWTFVAVLSAWIIAVLAFRAIFVAGDIEPRTCIKNWWSFANSLHVSPAYLDNADDVQQSIDIKAMRGHAEPWPLLCSSLKVFSILCYAILCLYHVFHFILLSLPFEICLASFYFSIFIRIKLWTDNNLATGHNGLMRSWTAWRDARSCFQNA